MKREKIIIEIDDKSHLEEASQLRDKKKDELVSRFDFITFRLKHPYTDAELENFAVKVKDEFIRRNGELYSCPIPVKKLFTPRKPNIQNFISYKELSEQLKDIMHGRPKWRLKRKQIMRHFGRVKDENKYVWAQEKLKEIREMYGRYLDIKRQTIVPLKIENTVIIRSRTSGDRKTIVLA